MVKKLHINAGRRLRQAAIARTETELALMRCGRLRASLDWRKTRNAVLYTRTYRDQEQERLDTLKGMR